MRQMKLSYDLHNNLKSPWRCYRIILLLNSTYLISVYGVGDVFSNDFNQLSERMWALIQ